MPFQKHEHYSSNELNLSRTCFALAHPARYRLIKTLQIRKTMTLPEIMKELNLSKCSVNRHINVLQEQELISQNFIPNTHFYSLNDNELRRLGDKFSTLLD